MNQYESPIFGDEHKINIQGLIIKTILNIEQINSECVKSVMFKHINVFTALSISLCLKSTHYDVRTLRVAT